MMRTLTKMVSAFLVLLASSASAQEEGHTKEPLDQVKAKVESGKAILVDVREQKEWDRGHVQKAVLLPLSKLNAWERDGMSEADKAALAKSLPKGSIVYCHCAAGVRALDGGEALRKLGYDARALKPGFRELIEAGFPRDPGK